MAVKRTRVAGAAWKASVEYLPEAYRLDHSADQYGVDRHFSPPEHGDVGDGAKALTKGLTPPVDGDVYSPIKEPFLVPPKYRKAYNFSLGHGKFLYSKDPLWVEARERHWDDNQIALQVHRKNYEHMRKQYKKQWQDAHRYNLDEYLSVMNRASLEEAVEREVSEERRTKEFEKDLARIDAINLLKEKRRRLVVENMWKRNVWMYERYTEDLQYLTQKKLKADYITFDNMDQKIEEQVYRHTARRGEASTLNMFGRIPLTEEDAVPHWDGQYTFMNEGLSDDGREAYKRLFAISENQTKPAIKKRDPTYAAFNFDDDLSDAEIDPTSAPSTPEDPSDDADDTPAKFE